ncbi:hypothetical protein SAMN05216605_10542 [Pseudomonas abietaniphila]|uniref:Uncharacterized protein n=1 Tax=Pseudomonas abietaniphila TaxID=89065 RepID=A0A1G8AG96_9PSED|nr:hypothetical protein SAMN05216605_10542 [Pseudomonas abietaniphila]
MPCRQGLRSRAEECRRGAWIDPQILMRMTSCGSEFIREKSSRRQRSIPRADPSRMNSLPQAIVLSRRASVPGPTDTAYKSFTNRSAS